MTNYGSGVLGDWSTLTNRNLGQWDTAEIGFVGDSILTAVQTALSARAVAEGVDIAVNCWSGRPFAPSNASVKPTAVEWLKTWQVMPKRLVIVCGSNDIFDPPAFKAAVEDFMTWMAANFPETKIYWVDTQVRRTGQTVAVQWCDQMNSGWINQIIHDRRDELAGIAPWSEFFCIDKNRPARYLRDGLHPTDGTTSSYNGVAAWLSIVWPVVTA